MSRVFSVFLLSLVVGCGSHSDSHDHHDHTGHGGGGSVSRDDADTYVAGLEKAGSAGHFTLRLMESEPAVHHTGVYTWQVKVLDPDGQPLTGLSIQAEPTMPNHGHGTEPRFSVGAPTDEGGLYELKDMDLYMEGIWKVMIRISSQDGVEDEADFSFYLEANR